MAEERIRIFAVDVRGLPDIPDPRLSELFPEWRAAEIRRYRMKEDRIRSAWAELLLRAMLEETCRISRTEQRILRRKDGKPYVSGKAAAGSDAADPAVPGSSGVADQDSGAAEKGSGVADQDSGAAEKGSGVADQDSGAAEKGSGVADQDSGKLPEISLSHSGTWAAASIGPVPHGIDVEVPRNPEMIPGIAERWFLPAEAEALRKAPETERVELFFRLWTVKESFLKMTGTGLREGPQAADALQLLSGGRTAAFSTVLPDGALLSCCGPAEMLPEAPEIFSGEKLRALYSL